MNYIYILEIGDVNDLDFDKLTEDLDGIFDLKVKKVGPIEKPDFAFDKIRKQYDAKKVLNDVCQISFLNSEKMLGILDRDLFAEGYNFIFGQAESPGRCCSVSTFRLDPRNVNKKFNSDLFYERVLKEAIHELGHNFGLSHCPGKSCPMYFSNNLTDTDFKGMRLCVKCEKLLEMSK